MIDIHVHTSFSFDSEEAAENYIAEAKKRGIGVIGFSEHYDYDAVLDGADVSLADVRKYFAATEKLKNDNPDIEILRGIELGYGAAALPEYRKLTEEYDFDYIINSVHTLPGRGDCYHPQFFRGKTLKESYADYFKAVSESVKADFDYQIVGHIGYVSRYRSGEGATIEYRDYAELLDGILKEIIRRDKCLEINTSSGTSGSEFLPDTDVIERYLSLGGKKLSYGSDAHRVTDYLRKSEALISALKNLGVKEMYYYKNRRAVPYKI